MVKTMVTEPRKVVMVLEEFSKIFSPEQVAYDIESRMMRDGTYIPIEDPRGTVSRIGKFCEEHLAQAGDKR